MGIDCCLKTEVGRFPLDRDYHFQGILEDGKVYSREEFVRSILAGMELHLDENGLCRSHWFNEALKNCGERNVILNEAEHYHGGWKDFFTEDPIPEGM